ncbi:hypothetical protein QQP08_009418 [Theobroma cacao]|uniref:Uncharacterized protein n=1 Tax=Theobroma cacao TaxID=3641 RepID=A0A061G2S1_THECC|nr:Uncharacterized protein TCM_015380 [Theobroma cacao]WRX16931.1 hypothetical protein QQP08_009418 [Theobroma cacao]
MIRHLFLLHCDKPNTYTELADDINFTPKARGVHVLANMTSKPLAVTVKISVEGRKEETKVNESNCTRISRK